MGQLLSGKKALIVGIASKYSIATAIGEAFHQQGAEIALTYQNEKLKSRVEDFAREWNSQLTFECDVGNDDSIKALFEAINEHWDGIDIIVHSVGFAPSDELDGNFVDVTTRDGFRIAHDISSYSFLALAQGARKLLQGRNSNLLTLTYHGARQVLPNYNVMGLAKASLEANVRYMAANLGMEGIRVNGISAGPIKTLAASAIKNFRKMLSENARRAPLGRNITAEEVAKAAVFMCSDMASGVTGEILYVDGGFNVTTMSHANAEDL